MAWVALSVWLESGGSLAGFDNSYVGLRFDPRVGPAFAVALSSRWLCPRGGPALALALRVLRVTVVACSCGCFARLVGGSGVYCCGGSVVVVRRIFVCGVKPLASGKPPRLKKELRRVRFPLAGFAVSAAFVGVGIEPPSSGKPPRLKKELRRVRLPIAGFAMSAALVGDIIGPPARAMAVRRKVELRRKHWTLEELAMSTLFGLGDSVVAFVCGSMWPCVLQVCHGLPQLQFQSVAFRRL